MKIIYNKSNLFKPAIFLDRDGVINKDAKGKYITSIKDVKIYPSAVEGLRRIKGYHLIILTNQSAIGRGMMSFEQSVEINNYIVDTLEKKGVIINAVYFCPHKPNERCICRKPMPGMIKMAMKDFKINIKKSIIVGDKASDIELGENTAIRSVMVLTGQGRKELTKLKKKPFAVIKNLISLKSIIKLLFFFVAINFQNAAFGSEYPFGKIFKKSAKTSIIERFEYDIYWGAMNVGSAVIEWGENYIKDDRDEAYIIKSIARSNSFIDIFFKVRDTNISYISTDTKRSYGYIKEIKEGGFQFSEYSVFDYSSGIFYGEHFSKNKTTKHSGELKGYVYDALSALFMVVHSDDPTQIKSINIATRKIKSINLIFHGIEMVKIPFGKFYAYKIEPTIGEEGIFVPKKGRSMYVYISKEERFPLMLEAEVFIGSVRAVLVNHIVFKK
ncbi:MAG: HAD-IIIA family hydrolase [Elusimicrobiales bacterium]